MVAGESERPEIPKSSKSAIPPSKSLAEVRTANTVAIYKKPTEAIAFAKEMADSIAALAGCNANQGRAVALVCMCEAINPLQFQQKYHFIDGKPSMKAQAQLAEYRMNEGGRYRIVKSDHLMAALEFVDAYDNKYDRQMTREELLLSRWPWISERQATDRKLPEPGGWRHCTARVRQLTKEGKSDQEVWEAMLPYYKDNYGTEADWKNMLMARLIGESMRAIAPEMAAGIYTPEEIRDVVDVDPISVRIINEPRPDALAAATAAAATAAAAKASQAAAVTTDEQVASAAAQDVAAGGATADDDAIDVPFEVTPQADAEREKQIEMIRGLYVQAFEDQADDAIQRSCTGRNVDSLESMSDEMLADVEKKIRGYIREKEDAAKNS